MLFTHFHALLFLRKGFCDPVPRGQVSDRSGLPWHAQTPSLAAEAQRKCVGSFATGAVRPGLPGLLCWSEAVGSAGSCGGDLV